MGEEDRMKKVILFNDENKIKEALENFEIDSFAGKKVPFKLHMGEKGNKYYPRPEFVKKVISELLAKKIQPYLFDTTVAYNAQRHTKQGYLKLAQMHNFTEEFIGTSVVIDDTGKKVEVEERIFEVADHLIDSKDIFAFTHVKGHIATGFGGAIKNFGMGGVTKETKLHMHHASRPVFQKDKCTYCGICAEVCPFDAITVDTGVWDMNMNKCFGCGVCVENCQNEGISHKDADIQFLLACAAKACVQDKNVIYLNELKRIAKGCDCDPTAGPIICPDIGYLVSDDIVAIDQASLDLVHDIKPDVFELENNVSPQKQIDYGEEIGLGSKNYQLIEI